MTRAHWLLVSNPTKVWDIWGWWLDGNRNFDRWTISKHWADISPGDDVALWITGKNAGVYAVGRATSGAEPFMPDEDDDYWIETPDPAKTRYVYLDVSQFLFDRPLYRSDLVAVPAFQDAFIIKMPNGGNPSPLTHAEWQVVQRHAGRAKATAQGPAGTSVLERPIGGETEEVLASGSSSGLREYREARLVKDYERWLGRLLRCHVIGLPTGERLVTDAYDARTGTLIEAKSSASRESVRMAIGQLADYSRHLPSKRLAVLLPEAPTPDVADLVWSQGIELIVRAGSGFVRRRGPRRA